MSKNNKVYEAIRELICLGFYTKKNLNNCDVFLGEYQYEDRKYEIHSIAINSIAILVKCENESLLLMVEDYERKSSISIVPIRQVYLHINNYRNIVLDDITHDLDEINEENIIYNSKIPLGYRHSSSMIYNPIENGKFGFDEKKYTIYHSDFFDQVYLKKQKCLKVFNGIFSPEVISNLISQVYPNLYFNSKINGIIDSLSREELLLLKQRVQEKEQGQLVKKLIKPNTL